MTIVRETIESPEYSSEVEVATQALKYAGTRFYVKVTKLVPGRPPIEANTGLTSDNAVALYEALGGMLRSQGVVIPGDRPQSPKDSLRAVLEARLEGIEGELEAIQAELEALGR
jgi:hypothetical protein